MILSRPKKAAETYLPTLESLIRRRHRQKLSLPADKRNHIQASHEPKGGSGCPGYRPAQSISSYPRTTFRFFNRTSTQISKRPWSRRGNRYKSKAAFAATCYNQRHSRLNRSITTPALPPRLRNPELPQKIFPSSTFLPSIP